MNQRKTQVAVESVESRLLFSAVVFDVVQAESSVALAGTVASTPSSGTTTTRPIEAQGPGTLTQKFTGTITADISGNTIRFINGSDIVAGNTAGDFSPEGTVAQANYAGRIINIPLPVIGASDVYFAMRDAAFGLSSAVRTMNASGQFPTAGITIQPLRGEVSYRAGFLSGSEDINQKPINSTATANSSLVVTNGVAKLQLPATMTMNQAIDALGSNVNGTINLTGKIVAIARTGSLKGTIYADNNGDGKKGTGEAGIVSRTVYIDANDNGIKDGTELTAVTNSAGVYLFSMLPAGTYTVRVAGVTPPQRIRSPWAGFHTATVTTRAVTTKDFGLTTLAPASVAGTVWNDLDADAVIKPGEAPLTNTRVFVDLDNDNTFDVGEPTDMTDAAGAYQLDNLPTNIDLYVRRILPAGTFYSTTATGNYHKVNLAPGSSRAGLNFGQTTLKGIRGNVFRDSNDNGIQDVGESGYSGVTVWLDADNDGVQDANESSQITTSSGFYRFATPPTGSNRVRIAVPAGTRLTTPSKQPQVVTFAVNTLVSANFGLTTRARISGTVFKALNTNATQETNEPVLSGRTVYLDLNLNGVLDSSEPSLVSPTAGKWSFGNLAPGNYRVRVIVPTTNAAVTSTFVDVSLVAAQHEANILFGMIDI